MSREKISKDRHAVVAFGRFQPVHSGHLGVAVKTRQVARQVGGDPMVFTSHTQDKSKNPLDYKTKHRFLSKAVGHDIVKRSDKGHSNLLGVLKKVNKTHNHLHMVAGADRHQEYKKLIDKYNGKEFNFKSVSFHVPPRGYSATQMRSHAKQGDEPEFKKHLPKGLEKSSHEVYKKVRQGMGLEEEFTYVKVAQNVDVLLYAGMGEQSKLSIYRQIMLNPWIAYPNPQYRKMLLRMFKIMRDVIFNNTEIYNRVKWDLTQEDDKVKRWSSDKPYPIHEGLTDTAIDLLMRLGLDDLDYLVLNRRIIKKPEIAINDSFLRKKLMDLFVKFRNLIILDQYIFTRAKTWVQSRRHSFHEEETMEGLRKISRFYRRPFDELLEVHDEIASHDPEVALIIIKRMLSEEPLVRGKINRP